MKKLFLLIIAAAAVFILYNRHRLFLRDPLGSVTRDGTIENGAKIFINFDNEVLIENDNPPIHVTLVQKRSPQEVGTPLHIGCIHFVACLTDADTGSLAEPAEKVDIVQMTGKLVEYRDLKGSDVQIKLR